MLAQEIIRLERENRALRSALEGLNSKIEQNKVLKPKSCQYCKNYIQHYRKEGQETYIPINYGHCICQVPVSKGRKKNPVPEDTCPYFELGPYETRAII